MDRSARSALAAFAVLLVVTTAFLGVGAGGASAGSSSGNLAPTFSLNDIYGHPFVLSSFRGNSAVVIEFTSITCASCHIVDQQLASVYAGYNATGHSDVQIISIFIQPQLIDTIPALKTFHDQNNVTWFMAQDTASLAVSSAYGVDGEIPDVFVINEQGQAIYQAYGAGSQATLQAKIAQALSGTAPAITIVTVSVFALAALAGVTTFFSPCAFPMFPGYMGLFLGLNAGAAASAAPSKRSYQGAARRALLAGSVTALGMLVVFAALGVTLVLAANAITGYVHYLLIAVGVVIIALGALLLTNLQYWRIVTPFQNLWRRIRGRPTDPASVESVVGTGDRLYPKLFGYGVGYAAAAAGCVAPVIFSAIFAGLALGLVGGLITVAIYALTAASLMIGTTVALGVASRRFINQLKAATPIIKKVSAVALIVVGAYLVYFYYTAWVL
jgi:cytochrome c-type biogenesis protein